METRVFWKQIFVTILFSFILKTSESLPLHESRQAIETGYLSLVSKEEHKNEAGVDIFDFILRVNSERKKISSGFGRMKNRAPDEGEELFQGDIIMTDDIRTALKNSHTDIMTLPNRKENGQLRKKRAVISHAQKKWPIANGQVEVPYVIETSSVPDKTIISQAMDHWHTNVPCISFVPRTNQPDYLSFFSGQGCFSWVGRKGGKQRISIGPGCAIMGVIAHEIGHALGFWHEQARPDRDKYVKILWNNIQLDNLDEFKMIDNSDTNDLGVEYDLASLMHYGPKAFSKSPSLNTIESLNGSTTFGQRNGLSDKDIEQARLLYCPRTNACQILYSDLNANCPSWGIIGYCDNKVYKTFMYNSCKKTCICKVCEDTNSGCLGYVNAGYCTNLAHKDWMNLNCRKSCGFCH